MIYVDPLTEYPADRIKPAARRFGNIWCHLTTDKDVKELHEFAVKLGLSRGWYQVRKRGIAHYDLVPSKRRLAVKLGAKDLDYNEMLKMTVKFVRGESNG